MYERRRDRVVRATRLWRRKLPERPEFNTGLAIRQLKKLSLSTQRNEKAAKGEVRAPPFKCCVQDMLDYGKPKPFSYMWEKMNRHTQWLRPILSVDAVKLLRHMV